MLSWPLALAFGRLFAQSRVFYIATKGKGLLAERALRIESVDAETGWHGLFADQPNLPATPARLLAGAHAIASFIADDGGTWERNVRALAPHAEVIAIRAHPPAGFAGHHTDFLVQQLQKNVVWQQGVIQMLSSLNQRGLGITATPGGPVVIHPGAGSPAKCWPIDRYLALAASLRSAGRTIRWVIGEAELERWPADSIQRLRSDGELLTPGSPVKLYEAMLGASAFVGNDSGPGHLAGVMGLPTVCLFGPTDPAVWKPIGPRVAALRSTDLTTLSADEVVAAVLQAAG